MDFSNLDKELQNEFRAKRLRAETNSAKNVARAFSVPTYAKLDSLEKEIVFELAKQKSLGSNTTELAKQLKIVRAKKDEILKKLGISKSDLSPHFECLNCNDTGFVMGKMCTCYKKRRNAEIIKSCGLDTEHLVSFDDFNTKICKNESQAKSLEKLKLFFVKWAEKYPNTQKKNIVLSGKTGLGKTFITKCLAYEMLKKNQSVCFVTAYDMNNMMLKYHTTFDASKNSFLIPLTESDILIIDDLGTEPLLTNVTVNYLLLVLSERERFDRPVIVTTNLTPDNILDKYGERIYSRLFSKITGGSFHLDGDDLRLSR